MAQSTPYDTKYGLFTDDGGSHWRGFARHYPSEEVYILEQDQTPGMDGANYTAVIGPLHHSEVTRERLEATIYPSDRRSEDQDGDCAWALEQTWTPIDLPAPSPVEPGYVLTEDGTILVQRPADNQWGFVLADDDQEWAGGIGVGRSWGLIDFTDPRLSLEDHERLGWLIDQQLPQWEAGQIKDWWEGLDTERFPVLNEEGDQVAEAEVRPTHTTGIWIYVDEMDGFRLMDEAQARLLIGREAI